MNGNWRSAGECDELLSKYKAFLVQMKQDHAVDFRDFTPDSRRLDTFLGNYMHDRIQFDKLWDIFKMLLTILHGQASVERGYSVNKDMVIENLHEKTVVALRTVHGSISTLEDHFTKLPLTPAMKRHVMSARMRYGQYLDEQKKESLNEQQRKKRKGVQLSIREAERKKSKVDTSINILGKEADDLAKWLQTTQPTSGGAVTVVSSGCANCVEPCGPAGWLLLLLTKAGDVETNPGPTTLNKKVWICDICHKQIHIRKQISIRCNRIEHWVHSDVQVSAKHNTQIPGPAIYTENPDSHLTQS